MKANVLFFDRKPGAKEPWTRTVWVYDLRTNKHFTLKTRDDGLSYQDYLEQLTFLLFLKMADERERLTGGMSASRYRRATGGRISRRRRWKAERADLRILFRLQEATGPASADAPGFRLHPFKGDRAGVWSVRVSGNWRVVFRFEDHEVVDVNLIDYH